MSTELEDEIRDALHARADAVTAARLHPRSAPARNRRRPPAWAVAAAVLVAALIAVGVAALAGSGGGKDQATGRGDALADTRWRVVAVTDHGSRQAITSRRVVVEFSANGDFGADDGVNFSSGHWRAEADGLRITDVGTTLVGYAGSDPAVLAAMQGIGALTADRGPVIATTTGNTLRLTASGVVLDLVRDGRPQSGVDPGFTGTSASPSAPVSSTGSPASPAPHSYVNGSELAPS